MINERLEDLATRKNIPLQRETSGRTTGTNTDSIFRSRGGIPATNLSLPLRYMHSPIETADLGDVLATVELLTEFIASLKPTDSFAYSLK